MSINIKLSGILAASTLFLASCGGASLTEIDELSDDTTDDQITFVKHFNTLQEHEKELNKDFSQALKEEDLKSLKDGSASIFENIDQREEDINQLEDDVKALHKKVKKIASYDGKEIDKKFVENLQQTFEEFNDQFNNYAKSYREDLKDQQAYLKEITKKKTTSDDFLEGVQEINDHHQDTQKELKEVRETLQTFDKQHEMLQKEITDALKKGEK